MTRSHVVKSKPTLAWDHPVETFVGASSRPKRLSAGRATQPQALTDGFSLAFWVAFGFTALSILATVLAIRRADLRADVSPATPAT